MNPHLKNAIKRTIPNAYIIRTLKTHHKTVLITFDDGPHAEITPQVLALLDRHNVRAVFFVVGKYAVQHPDLLLEIKHHNHLIGNHSYDHPNRRMPTYTENLQEVSRCQDLIHRIIGEKPHYYRPPMGIISLNGLRAAKHNHLKTVIWSCEGRDWEENPNQEATQIAENILNKVKPKDIICLHDNQPKILKTLEKLLPTLNQKGYNLKEAPNYLPK